MPSEHLKSGACNLVEKTLVDPPYPTGKLSAEYKLRHDRFPDIPVKVHPVLFPVVGLAPAHDGADLAAQEAETFREATSSWPSFQVLALLVLHHPGRVIAHDMDRISYFRRRDCGK